MAASQTMGVIMKYLIAWLWLFNPALYTDPDLPPAIYDHPFAGEVVLTELSTEPRVRKICEAFGANILPGGAVMACAFAMRGKCFIFSLGEADLKAYGHEPKNVLRHERAHCNGWTHTRPQIQFPK